LALITPQITDLSDLPSPRGRLSRALALRRRDLTMIFLYRADCKTVYMGPIESFNLGVKPMFKFKLGVVLLAGMLGMAAPANAATVTDFSLTFELSPSDIIGTGTLGITGFVAGATYGAGASAVTEFDATINGHAFNFIGAFSALDFTGNALTAVTANAGANPNTVLFTSNDLKFTYFFNAVPQVDESGTLVVAEEVTTAVPEPSTWAMIILGFCGLGFMAYRRKQNGSSAFSVA
jgi:hypothetical protein